jgi:hypothetical protein
MTSRGNPVRGRKRKLTDADLDALNELSEKHDYEVIDLLRRHNAEIQAMRTRHWHERNDLETGGIAPPGKTRRQSDDSSE